MIPTAPRKRTPTTALTPEQRRERTQLLDTLTYEMDEGQPIYYAGYQDVLSGKKQVEEITGSSGLQSHLIEIIQGFLFTHPLRKRFRYLSNEIGVQINKKKWRACDIAIYERDRLKDYIFNEKYMAIPPDYVIEIDTKADLSKYQYQHDYFIEKTRQLHDFGVKKVIWVFTKNIPVIWESDSADASIIRTGWDHDVTIMEGMTFNLEQLVQAEQA